MKRQYSKTGNEGRHGVALIIVLGFLSIMVMMALAFLTQARTERMVADSTLEAQRGRQLVRTAVSAAMNDYSAELFPRAGNKFLLPPPGMEVFPSICPGGLSGLQMKTLGDDGINLMAGEASDWIPRRYLTAEAEDLAAGAEWIPVRENPTGTSRILGRYAYVCFDMSGGIDANLIGLNSEEPNGSVITAGNPTNRASVRDVGLGTGDTLAETLNADEFKRLRSGWHGFDTLSEIIKLTDGHYVDGQQDFASGDDLQNFGKYPTTTSGQRWRGNRVERTPALDPDLVTDLAPYSLSAYRGVYDFGAGAWRYASVQSCGRIKTAQEWDDALADVWDQMVDKPQTILAIQDYTNAHNYPIGVTYPSVKNVPMFNELKTEYRFQYTPPPVPGGPSEILLDVRLNFEVWYPFPSKDNPEGASFWIDPPTIGYNPKVPGATDNAWLRPDLLDLTTGNQIPFTVVQITAASGQRAFNSSFNGGNPELVPGVFEYNYRIVPNNPSNLPMVASQLGLNVFLDMRTNNAPGPKAGVEIKRLDSQMAVQVVDRMLMQGLALDMVPGAEFIPTFKEAVDPRLNHDYNYWVDGADTMGGINAATLSNPEYEKEGKYMFCRNGPMRSPAELGFIPTGRPWETIDLCNPDGALTLARLVASDDIVAALNDPAANRTFYTNGTINPNTVSTNVLLAAFAGLTKLEVPNPRDDIPSEEVSLSEARTLAESMINSKTNVIREEGGAFMAGSDWVRVSAMVEDGELARTGMNENQRESLIRNTWGLFSPNNSLFTVLVIAQAIKEAPGPAGVWKKDEDMITGERRAVALVWRDPTPSGNTGHHEMFVRMYKLLDE